MKQNYRMTLQYEGTKYNGWQKQGNTPNTIQAKLEAILQKLDGTEVDKLFTFHNYVGGWYFQLNRDWVSRITVVQSGHAYDFYIWDHAFENAEKMMTIYAYTGQYREDQAVENGRFVLYRGESVVYAAKLEDAAYTLGITREDVTNGFHMIQQEWKTGETD